ncbi:MAG: hypothetical protein CMJ23_00735 [Phycisphaerae bacterium]|nr:hypothetical protein [Phycisphaerae bacterium]
MALIRAAILAFVISPAIIACSVRTPGSGPQIAGDREPPPLNYPLWTDPPSPEASEVFGRGQPVGFAVLDPKGRAISMTRHPDRGSVEIWEATPFPVSDVISVIDADLIGSVTGRIAIIECAAADPRAGHPVPRRRAVDGLLFQPAGARNQRLAIILGSLARFNPGERWMTEAFLRDGWCVLVSSPPINSPDPTTRGRTRVAPAADPEKAGRILAAEFDVAIGSWAVGLAAIMRQFEADALIPSGPMALVGMSSGGLASPMIAAALDPIRRTAAASLIATGIDPALIIARTSLRDDDLRIERRGPRISDHDLPRFLESYREASTLDGENLNRWFADRPLLVIEAGFDAAIPAESRRRLRERHAKAAYWWLPTGHYGLFAALLQEADQVVRWFNLRMPHPEGTAESLDPNRSDEKKR